MLSSTAKNIYWMGRYLQRAKSTARLIEATQRMALQSRGEEAAGVAAIFGMEDEFRQTQQQSSGRLASLIDFLVEIFDFAAQILGLHPAVPVAISLVIHDVDEVTQERIADHAIDDGIELITELGVRRH